MGHNAGGEPRAEGADELLQPGPQGRVHAPHGPGRLPRIPPRRHERPPRQLLHPHLRVHERESERERMLWTMYFSPPALPPMVRGAIVFSFTGK